MGTKVGTSFKYKPLMIYNGLPGKLKVVSKKMRFGVEVEIENSSLLSHPPNSFHTVDDGSLKVNGVEFVSRPIELQFLEVELTRLKGTIVEKENSFSKRCSIHVHVNVRDMTWEELYVFKMIYLIYERHMFNFSGNRNNNPFCIPLYHTPEETKTTNKKILSGVNKNLMGNKYRAFNVCPIYGGDGSHSIGTVEFRHMEGNLDIPRIITWMNLIACLKLASKKFTVEELHAHIRTLNTTSGYGWFTKTVFGQWQKHLIDQPNFISDMEEGIITAKLCMVFPEKKVNKYFKVEF